MKMFRKRATVVLQALVLRLNCVIRIEMLLFYYPISSTLKELGRSGCRELYLIEKRFHDLILSEGSYNIRCELYSELANAIKVCKAKYTSAKAFGWSPGLLKDWIHLFRQKDVLDYGCGYGGSTFFLGTVANSVTGVDSAEVCIRIAYK